MRWIARAIIWLSVLVSVLALLGAVLYGANIEFRDQWPLYEALRNTAAIIFAVVGAWLAIIYPERLKLSFGKAGKNESSTKNFILLLTPAIHSTFILVIILAVGVAAPIIKNIPGALHFVGYLRQASFVLLVSLTLWQIAIVVISVVPIEMLLNQASDEDAARKLDAHYGSRHQKP